MLEAFSMNRNRSRAGLMARMLLAVLGIFLCAGALAQNVALKGVVKDNTGEKLTGVSIIVENTSTATANIRSKLRRDQRSCFSSSVLNPSVSRWAAGPSWMSL